MKEIPKRISSFSSNQRSGGIIITYSFALITILTVIMGFVSKGVILSMAVIPDSYHEKQAHWNAVSGLEIASGMDLSLKRTFTWDMGEFDVSGPNISVNGNAVTIENGDDTPSPDDHTDFESNSTRIFTIVNNGSETLLLAGTLPDFVEVGGTNAADFTVSSQPTSPILSGENSAFTVTFSSSATGTRTAQLTIPSNGGEYFFSIQAGVEVGGSSGAESSGTGSATGGMTYENRSIAGMKFERSAHKRELWPDISTENQLYPQQTITDVADVCPEFRECSYTFSRLVVPINVTTEARWSFRAGLDAGYGCTFYMDGVEFYKDDDNLWWSQKWTHHDVVEDTITLEPGSHTFEIYWAENCCDGGSDFEFKDNPDSDFKDLTIEALPPIVITVFTPVALVGDAYISVGKSVGNRLTKTMEGAGVH